MEQLKGFIVKKLFQHGYISGRHTAFDNLKKGLPSHEKGDVSKVAKELIKEEILISKPMNIFRIFSFFFVYARAYK